MPEEYRTKCLAYVSQSYPEWPLAYETSHTKICHYGYSWVLNGDEWRLENAESSDFISEQDVKEYRSLNCNSGTERIRCFIDADNHVWSIFETGKSDFPGDIQIEQDNVLILGERDGDSRVVNEEYCLWPSHAALSACIEKA